MKGTRSALRFAQPTPRLDPSVRIQLKLNDAQQGVGIGAVGVVAPEEVGEGLPLLAQPLRGTLGCYPRVEQCAVLL